MVGFTNLGSINDHLADFERSLTRGHESNLSLAKTMVVFMVRGLFTSLQFPYVHFACTNLCGDQMYDPLWEAIWRIENCGLKVLGLTLDGASVNRSLVKLHQSLWCKGKNIWWSHVKKFYEEDSSVGLGLRMVPKLKYEHLHINSFSAMRVDLAAQVLSESVSHALHQSWGKGIETIPDALFVTNRFSAEGMSFLELVPYLFSMPDIQSFLCQRLCQDPLERFFGLQRQRGGVHENPNAVEFAKNTQALRVMKSVGKSSSFGNCRRGLIEQASMDELCEPLPKRRRTSGKRSDLATSSHPTFSALQQSEFETPTLGLCPAVNHITVL
ncbi:hypothetical protein EMCRGX_G020817 [Ephydatia muelleri]